MSTTLIQYLRDLPDDAAREDFAKRVESSVGHLRNVGYGYKPCHPKLAAAVWRESGEQVSRQSLCPDDYWLIWPDLPAPAPAPAEAG
jgi:hypothetical protein